MNKLTGNPMLVAPGTGGGAGGTNSSSTLSGCQLPAGSPCINSGLTPTANLARNANAASWDFFGGPVPFGAGADRGARFYKIHSP